MGKAFEVVVVGLGAVGSAVAHRLALRGVRVLGLDRHHPPHEHGSSHGETRITRLALGEGAEYVPLVRRSHEIWRELERATGACLLRQVGGLVYGRGGPGGHAHGSPDFLGTTVQVAQDHGIAHEILGADELERRFPQFRFRGDETGYLEPEAGLVHPEACITAQLSEAVRLGAELRMGEPLLEWREGPGSVGVRTAAGWIGAGRLVLTAGAWMPEWVPGLASRARVCRQVLGWFEVAGDPGLFDPRHTPVFIRVPEAGDEMFYGFPEVGGAGTGVKVATEQFEKSGRADELEAAVGPGETDALYGAVAPHLRIGPRCLRAVACKYTLLPDFRFLVDGYPGSDRVALASACSGHGFKHSSGVGEALATWVIEGRRPAVLEPFRWRA